MAMTLVLPMPTFTRRDFLAFGAASLAAAPLAAREHHRTFLFGSPVDLLLPDATHRDELVAGLAAMNRRWNAWKPGEVSAVNAAFRAGRSARVTPALAALMQGAARLERLSHGYFNAAIGGLVGAWGFHADRLADGPRPDAAVLERWRAARPSLQQLEWRGLEVRSRNPAVQLDFGAYAKGVALDWALDRLQARGVTTALVNLGGNLAAMAPPGASRSGEPLGMRGGLDEPWRIGVRDPFDPSGQERLATLEVQGREAVVTSGSYERFRRAGGERVTHIIDPAGGSPAPELVSVTVVHRDAALADVAATALLVAGPARWRALAGHMGVDQVLVVDRHGRQEVTARLASRLTPGACSASRRIC